MAPTLLQYNKVKHASYKIPETYTAIEYIVNVCRNKLSRPIQGLEDRILIIKCATGSGKSTVMPVALFQLLRDPELNRGEYNGKSVICTQPRVLTAIDIAVSQIAGAPHYPHMKLDETVGYRTGDFKSDKQKSMLLYSTIGSFKQEIASGRDSEVMDKYGFIIIDEAHERSLDTDLALMEIKYFYQRNASSEKLPILILTSATIDEYKYARYFGVGDLNIITVSGFTYPIEVTWGEDVPDVKVGILEKVLKIHDENTDDPRGKGDIIVFVSGTGGFKDVKENIEVARKDLLVVFADRTQVSNQTNDYLYLTGKIPLPKDKNRMIIIATNAAETGLTVDSLKYVVDTGYSNVKETYYPKSISGVILRPIAESNALQRKGRSGRKFPGAFYPLYSYETYKALQKQQFPNIVTEGVEDIIVELVKIQQENKLRMKVSPEFRLEDLNLLDLPPVDALMGALDKAIVLGLVSFNAVLPNAETRFSENSGPTGFGITPVGLESLFLRRALPRLESIAVLLYSFLFPNIRTEEAILLAIACVPGRKMPRSRSLPDNFSELREMMSCQIIESMLIWLWKMKNNIELSSLVDISSTFVDIMDVLYQRNYIMNEAPSILEFIDDPVGFGRIIEDYRRLLSFCLRFNTINTETFSTVDGLRLKGTPPTYFKKSPFLYTTGLNLKSGFGDNVIYNIMPDKVGISLGMHCDIMPAKTIHKTQPVDLNSLYLYFKLHEI